MAPTFVQLNKGWNAEPNAPHPVAKREGADVLLEFSLNSFQYPLFSEANAPFGSDQQGILRFASVSKFRLGATNDEGWYLGQCRYSKLAPTWGGFYELRGDDPLRDVPTDWKTLTADNTAARHFLFYLRDETFEAIADDWSFADAPDNALLKLAEEKYITGRIP